MVKMQYMVRSMYTSSLVSGTGCAPMHMPDMAPAGQVVEDVGMAEALDCSEALVAETPLCSRLTCRRQTIYYPTVASR